MAQSAAARAFDVVVIGGGSGGIAFARRAAGHGAKVALVEAGALGGTCVNLGCVPKKIMFNATSLLHDVQHAAAALGVRAGGNGGNGGSGGAGGDGGNALSGARIDLAALKAARDEYVGKLATTSYPGYLASSGVELVRGFARFVDARTVEVSPPGAAWDAAAAAPAEAAAAPPLPQLTAPHILIATGGAPRSLGIPGSELTINSDGVFDLAAAPKTATVIGGGYIGVEMAGILRGLGASVTVLVRDAGANPVLRGFDESMRAAVVTEMRRAGIAITGGVRAFTRVARRPDGALEVLGLGAGAAEGSAEAPLAPPADLVLQAVGRDPSVRGLRLEAAGVKVGEGGLIAVDDFQNTSAAGVYALGDAASTGFPLTPVAIAAGRLLADRLFGGAAFARARVSYSSRNIPTVVFSHPPLGTVGLTEAQAVAAHGAANIKVYSATFVGMLRALMPRDAAPRTTMKVIARGAEEVVVGLHVHGDGADEMLQGFAVAVAAGLTMRDFNATMAYVFFGPAPGRPQPHAPRTRPEPQPTHRDLRDRPARPSTPHAGFTRLRARSSSRSSPGSRGFLSEEAQEKPVHNSRRRSPGPPPAPPPPPPPPPPVPAPAPAPDTGLAGAEPLPVTAARTLAHAAGAEKPAPPPLGTLMGSATPSSAALSK